MVLSNIKDEKLIKMKIFSAVWLIGKYYKWCLWWVLWVCDEMRKIYDDFLPTGLMLKYIQDGWKAGGVMIILKFVACIQIS